MAGRQHNVARWPAQPDWRPHEARGPGSACCNAPRAPCRAPRACPAARECIRPWSASASASASRGGREVVAAVVVRCCREAAKTETQAKEPKGQRGSRQRAALVAVEWGVGRGGERSGKHETAVRGPLRFKSVVNAARQTSRAPNSPVTLPSLGLGRRCGGGG